MARFVHICASQNDLFALDQEGNVCQYDFNAKTWVTLVESRADDNHRPRAETQDVVGANSR